MMTKVYQLHGSRLNYMIINDFTITEEKDFKNYKKYFIFFFQIL